VIDADAYAGLLADPCLEVAPGQQVAVRSTTRRHCRRSIGEIGIGTNFGLDRPVGAILLDEKIGDTVHLALCRSCPDTGGTNESAVHWDMVCDLRRGGRMTADGEPVVADGGPAAG
jgi:aminopeptidase